MLTYAIAYIRDFLADLHVIGETFETTAPWSKIQQICQGVESRLQERHREFGLPGRPYISYRITQLYHTGVCIYFMFGVYTKGVESPEEVFGRIEYSLREAILKNGGSISHHHGVGKIRKDFMTETLSASSIELLRNLKQCHDPQNIFGIRNNVFTDDSRGLAVAPGSFSESRGDIDINLESKTAVITGASSGLGRRLALDLAQRVWIWYWLLETMRL